MLSDGWLEYLEKMYNRASLKIAFGNFKPGVRGFLLPGIKSSNIMDIAHNRYNTHYIEKNKYTKDPKTR